MTKLAGQARPLDHVDLVATPDFSLGPARVRPAHRQLVGSDGGVRELEPRVMQVLIALAGAQGEVVSRDELNSRCWDGRIVGDDSINRCIVKLRRIARSFDPAPFDIETIAKVGYSLVAHADDGEARLPVAADRPSPGKPPDELVTGVPVRRGALGVRRLLLAGIVAGALVVIALLAGLPPFAGSSGDRPALAVVDGAGSARSGFAREIASDLIRLAGARTDRVSVVEDVDDASLFVRVSARRSGNVVRGDAVLSAGGAGEVLWSGTVELPLAQAQDARPQLAAKLGAILLCALELPAGSESLDPPTTRMYLASCEAMEGRPGRPDVDRLRRVTEAAPGFARGWAMLAAMEAGMVAFSEDPTKVRDLAEAARRHLGRARSLDPDLGDTYVAEADLIDRGAWAERLAILRRGTGADPAHAALHERLSRTLFQVGRSTEAIQAARSAADLNPLSVSNRAALIFALAHAGEIGRARLELDQAERLWPASSDLHDARFVLELRYGDAARAQAMLLSGKGKLSGPAGTPEALIRARLEPTPKNIAHLVDAMTAQSRRASAAVGLRIQALAQFGRIDEVYDVIDQPGGPSALQDTTEILFRPHMRAVREDRRFVNLAHRLGLLAFWSRTGAWPDFCADPRLPYRCEVEARRLQPLR